MFNVLSVCKKIIIVIMGVAKRVSGRESIRIVVLGRRLRYGLDVGDTSFSPLCILVAFDMKEDIMCSSVKVYVSCCCLLYADDITFQIYHKGSKFYYPVADSI